MLALHRLVLALVFLAPLTACSGDDGDGGNATEGGQTDCEYLGDLCHDVPGADALMCHELGHDGDEAACTAMKAACVDICSGAGSSSGGSTSGGSGSGSDTGTSG